MDISLSTIVKSDSGDVPASRRGAVLLPAPGAAAGPEGAREAEAPGQPRTGEGAQGRGLAHARPGQGGRGHQHTGAVALALDQVQETAVIPPGGYEQYLTDLV